MQNYIMDIEYLEDDVNDRFDRFGLFAGNLEKLNWERARILIFFMETSIKSNSEDFLFYIFPDLTGQLTIETSTNHISAITRGGVFMPTPNFRGKFMMKNGEKIITERTKTQIEEFVSNFNSLSSL